MLLINRRLSSSRTRSWAHAPTKGLQKAFHTSSASIVTVSFAPDVVARSGAVIFCLYSLSLSRFLAALPRRARIHPTSCLHQG